METTLQKIKIGLFVTPQEGTKANSPGLEALMGLVTGLQDTKHQALLYGDSRETGKDLAKLLDDMLDLSVVVTTQTSAFSHDSVLYASTPWIYIDTENHQPPIVPEKAWRCIPSTLPEVIPASELIKLIEEAAGKKEKLVKYLETKLEKERTHPDFKKEFVALIQARSVAQNPFEQFLILTENEQAGVSSADKINTGIVTADSAKEVPSENVGLISLSSSSGSTENTAKNSEGAQPPEEPALSTPSPPPDEMLFDWVTKIISQLALYRSNGRRIHQFAARKAGLNLISCIIEHRHEFKTDSAQIIADDKDPLGTLRFSLGITKGVEHTVSDTTRTELPPFVSTIRAKDGLDAKNRACLRYKCVQHQRDRGGMGRIMPPLDYIVYSKEEIQKKIPGQESSGVLAVLFSGHIIGPTLGEAYAALRKGIIKAIEEKEKEKEKSYRTIAKDLLFGAKNLVELWHLTPPPLERYYEECSLIAEKKPEDLQKVYLLRHTDFGRIMRASEKMLFYKEDADLWDKCGSTIITKAELFLSDKTIRARMDPWELNFKIETGRIPKSSGQLLQDLEQLSSQERQKKVKPIPDPHLSFCHWAEDFMYLISPWTRHFAPEQIRFRRVYGQNQEELFTASAQKLKMPPDPDQLYLFGFLVNVYGAKLTTEKLTREGKKLEDDSKALQFYGSHLKQARTYLSQRMDLLAKRYYSIRVGRGKCSDLPKKLPHVYKTAEDTSFDPSIAAQQLRAIKNADDLATGKLKEKNTLRTQHFATWCLYKLLEKTATLKDSLT